jgi:acyl carrier protein
MTTAPIEEQIREFLTNNFIFDQSAELGLDDSLMGNGIVDSTGILEVIMWVESNFGIHVEDSEVLPENFDSILNIKNYAIHKMNEKMAKAS